MFRLMFASWVTTFLMISSSFGQGFMMPRDRSLPPMQLVNHRVKVMLEDQVAITTVRQTFRNNAPRPLEAVYTFNVPKGATVREFSMLINGKKVKGELVEAAKAKHIYTEIVRRTMDPGLLEYVGTDLLQLSVFPVPAQGEQEVEVSFTSVVGKQETVVEYLYPLRAQSNMVRIQGEFSFEMELKSSRPIHSIYSPTHPISFTRKNDRQATIFFDRSLASLDRDLQLFYTMGKDDIGLTLLQHRPEANKDGYVMLLLAPRAEIAQDQRVPRDMVFVLDSSGSMREDGKLEQAKKALKYGIDSLKPGDRFTVLNFATTVNSFSDKLVEQSELAAARKWVDGLEPTGGTAINDAMLEALKYQSSDKNRTFQVIFFTDGKPTVGETNVENILRNVDRNAAANTRIFTFGVGYDLDAGFLDRLAEKHKGISSYVKPNEDMEIKVSYFFTQINQPVLTDLKLTTSSGVRLTEVYPPQLPDLFHGGQLVVMARTQGTGKTTVRLTGQVGTSSKEFNYDVEVLEKTEPRSYVEDLWARRKVGYMLDQIRLGGEKKELVDEVTLLAKKYGIATPYTSYLVIPDDVPVPQFHRDRRLSVNGVAGGGIGGQEGLNRHAVKINDSGTERKVQTSEQYSRKEMAGGVATAPPGSGGGKGAGIGDGDKSTGEVLKMANKDGIIEARSKANVSEAQSTLNQAKESFYFSQGKKSQEGKLGVDLASQLNDMKNQQQQGRQVQRMANRRNCIEINGVWVDEQYKKDTPTFAIKTMSNAYFKLLEKQPAMKEVLSLSKSVVWIAPNGTALVFDPSSGKEEISDEEIEKLFKAVAP